MSRRSYRPFTRAARWLLALACALALLPWRGPAPAAAAACTVTTVADAFPAPAGSLRAALDDAGCATITFGLSGAGPWIISLAAPLIIGGHDVAIVGPGRDLLTIDGLDARIPLVITGGGVTVEGLTIAHGRGVNAPGGGARITGGTVALRHARVRYSYAVGSGGGGLYIGGGSVTLDDMEVLGNDADADANDGGGAGIYADQTYASTDLLIRNSTIAGNNAAGRGGGIFAVRWGGQASPKTLTVGIEGSTIADNRTGSGGGGIYGWQATLTVTNSTIRGNRAAPIPPAVGVAFGGGIRLNGGIASLTGSTIVDNGSNDTGGGIFASSATLTIQTSTLVANGALYGGAITAHFTTLTLSNSTISGNEAEVDGGGVRLLSSLATFTGATIVRNNAGAGGGGLQVLGDTSLALALSLVAGNLVSNDAGDCVSADPVHAQLHSGGGNVVGAGGGCPADQEGDLAYAGTLAALFAPALADNGGPTPTHALPPGSPAIDRTAGACATASDQRGVDRPQGNGCDSGAVEATATLTIQAASGGTVRVDPPGSAGGSQFTFSPGMVVTLTPQPGAGQVFTGWLVDGAPQGWAAPLTLTMGSDHLVLANFAPLVGFADVGSGRADFAAVAALATRGTIRGYGNGNYGPDDGVTRAQMAALIARATPSGLPAGHTLAPPACLVAGSWDCEDWGNGFTDRDGLDGNLWRNVGVLQHHGVANGLDGVHFGPGSPVTYAQTISFITRAMQAKGYWVAQPGAPLPAPGVPTAHAADARTFAYYTGGIPASPADWNAPATRGWFALALWRALDSYWGTDGSLPDGRPAGGFAP